MNIVNLKWPPRGDAYKARRLTVACATIGMALSILSPKRYMNLKLTVQQTADGYDNKNDLWGEDDHEYWEGNRDKIYQRSYQTIKNWNSEILRGRHVDRGERGGDNWGKKINKNSGEDLAPYLGIGSGFRMGGVMESWLPEDVKKRIPNELHDRASESVGFFDSNGTYAILDKIPDIIHKRRRERGIDPSSSSESSILQHIEEQQFEHGKSLTKKLDKFQEDKHEKIRIRLEDRKSTRNVRRNQAQIAVRRFSKGTHSDKPKTPLNQPYSQTCQMNPRSGQRNPSLAPRNPGTTSRNPQSLPRNPRASSRNRKSQTRNPRSRTRSHSRNPRANSRNPRSQPRNPRTSSRNPRSHRRNPRSHRRNPRSSSSTERSGSRSPRSRSRSPRPRDRSPEQGTRNPRLDHRNPESYTRNPRVGHRNPRKSGQSHRRPKEKNRGPTLLPIAVYEDEKDNNKQIKVDRAIDAPNQFGVIPQVIIDEHFQLQNEIHRFQKRQRKYYGIPEPDPQKIKPEGWGRPTLSKNMYKTVKDSNIHNNINNNEETEDTPKSDSRRDIERRSSHVRHVSDFARHIPGLK
ncbi:hypothetical protein AAMO2058_001369600 [Amorphochlora amoebiformis]